MAQKSPLPTARGLSPADRKAIERADRMRSAAYRDVVVAGDMGAVMELYWLATSAEIKAQFESFAGGVWCAGAAQYLVALYNENGFESVLFFYGFPDGQGLMHTVALVRIGKRWFLQDAYFDIRTELDIFETMALSGLDADPPLREPATPARRRTLYSESAAPKLCWTFDPEDKAGAIQRLDDGRMVIWNAHTVDLFAQRWPHEHAELWKQTCGHIADAGAKPDMQSMILWPIAVSGPKGYVQDPENPVYDGLLGRLCEAAAARREIIARIRDKGSSIIEDRSLPS